MKNSARLAVRLAPEVYDRFQAVADSYELTGSHLLRIVLRQYLATLPGAPIDVAGVRSERERAALSDTKKRVEDISIKLSEAACQAYDAFIGQGLDANIAISRTNAVLKASHFPWTTYETTKTVLRRSGRFKALPLPSLSGRPDRAK